MYIPHNGDWIVYCYQVGLGFFVENELLKIWVAYRTIFR